LYQKGFQFTEHVFSYLYSGTIGPEIAEFFLEILKITSEEKFRILSTYLNKSPKVTVEMLNVLYEPKFEENGKLLLCSYVSDSRKIDFFEESILMWFHEKGFAFTNVDNNGNSLLTRAVSLLRWQPDIDSVLSLFGKFGNSTADKDAFNRDLFFNLCRRHYITDDKISELVAKEHKNMDFSKTDCSGETLLSTAILFHHISFAHFLVKNFGVLKHDSNVTALVKLVAQQRPGWSHAKQLLLEYGITTQAEDDEPDEEIFNLFG